MNEEYIEMLMERFGVGREEAVELMDALDDNNFFEE